MLKFFGIPICFCGLLLASLAQAVDNAPAPTPNTPKPKAEEEVPAKGDEQKLRERFQAAYQSAEKPALRADTVLMLKGVKEEASKRLITGMLGDPLPTVKRNACRVMAETEDPEGYFVKPLTAALGDRNMLVRSAAAEALTSAKIKGLAVKALVLALSESAREGEKQTAHSKVLHTSLTKLTGNDLGAGEDYTKFATQWHTWWQDNRERLKAEDDKYLEELAAKNEKKE